MSDVIIGIDLGTSNSEVAVSREGKIEIVTGGGSALVPSYVGLTPEGTLVVGQEARNQYVLYPQQTIRSIKREMGNQRKFKLGDGEYLPQEISAMILKTLKARAEAHLGEPVTRAVITVPAQFNDAQRQATRDAGQIAGLEVLRIINEPTAACLAYKPEDSRTGAQKVLVFDLGGGTFDVSIVTIEEDVVEVIASRGDNHLGGDDMDNLIEEWIVRKIYDQQDTPEVLSEQSRLKLKHTAETAKIHLSDHPYARIIEDGLLTTTGEAVSFEGELERSEFETLLAPLLNKMLVAVHEALADAHLTAGKIDEIVLVGGATRVPAVSRMLEEELSLVPRQEIHPDLAVAYGAGVLAARLMGRHEHRILIDITPYTFGTSCLGFVKGEYVPYRFIPVLKAGTPLPAVKSESFCTVQDNQEKVEVDVFQGESEDARDNILVGDFMIEGLSRVPEGNEIVLNMQLDLDGILHVTAREKSTNLTKQIKIENATGRLDEEAIRKSSEAVSRLFGEHSASASDHGNAESDGEAGPGKELKTRLKELEKKARALAGKMDDLDKGDTEQLLETLRKACSADNTRKFDKTATELQDLFFYLETE